jgi:hypothetical protein
VVEKSWGVETRVDRGLSAINPNNDTEFVLTINNTGNFEDRFMIAGDLGPGSPLVVSLSASTMALEAWSEGDVEVNVHVPHGTIAGDYPITLDVISLTDMTVSSTEEVVVQVNFVAKPDLEFHHDERTTVYRGDDGAFSIVVLNEGNVLEDLDVSYGGGLLWWDIKPTSNIILEPDENGDVIVDFHVPKDTATGYYDVEIVFESEYGVRTVVHRVEVLKRPDTGEPDRVFGELGDLPFFIIIAILAAFLLVALGALVRGKSGKGGGTMTHEPPATHQGYEQPMPQQTADRPPPPGDDEEEVVTLLDVMMEDPDDIQE